MNYYKINNVNNGFTLLEALLYTGIVVIVAGLAVGTLLTTIKIQNTSTAFREVSEQARFIIEAMTREVRDSSLIDISTSTESTKLVLRMSSTSRDYVAFYASGTSMWMDVGTSSLLQTIATTTTRLNTDKVSVVSSTVSFIRIFNPPSKDAVQVSFTLYYNANVSGISSSTKQFTTTLDRITSASIGDDLVPSANTLDVGTTSPQLRWKNVRLTDKLLIGVDNAREVSDTDPSDRVVLGYTNGALKLLGTSTPEFFKFSNSNNNLTINIRNILGSPFEALRISSTTGNILIGGDGSQTEAGEKLEVVGNIISKGTEWTTRTAGIGSMQGATYGNGLFVAVGNNSVITSPDGINWTSRTPAANLNWHSVVYGNGLFVAMVQGGSCNGALNQCIMTSPEGVNWSIRTAATSSDWRSIAYGNGTFVAVGFDVAHNYVMTSPDGINWTSRNAAAIRNWDAITYGNGKFVALANNGGVDRVMYSTDGISWASSSGQDPNDWQAITYGNGLFVGVAQGVTSGFFAMSSPDGITWTRRATPADNKWGGVTYGNGLFVAVSSMLAGTSCTGGAPNYCVMTSPDGINWTLRSTAGLLSIASAYGNGTFVAGVAGTYVTSGKMDEQITPSNNIFQGGLSIMGPSTGILGIGTTTPMALMTIATTTTSASGVSTSTAIFNITSDGLVGMGTSTLPKSALSVTGNFRMYDTGFNRFRVDIYSSSGSSTFKTYDKTSNTLMPLELRASSINYTNYKTNQTWGTIDSNSNWYLGGSTTTGVRFSTSAGTSTILKSQGNLLIADGGGNNSFVYLQGDNIGIGTTTPQTKLQVIGNIKIGTPSDAGSIFNYDDECIGRLGGCPSDARLKKNFEPLTGSLDKIIQLNPVSYKWRADEFPKLKLNGEKLNIGLIAQDVQKIYPEFVKTDDDGYEAINYGTDLNMHILEAIKELKAKNDALKERAKILESELK